MIRWRSMPSACSISEVGFYAKGAIPSGTTKWTYDIYATNGPNLITSDPGAAGQLNFNDYTDLNNGKAYGGRIGFDARSGYGNGLFGSILRTESGQLGKVHAFLQAVDFHHKPTVKACRAGSSIFQPNGSGPRWAMPPTIPRDHLVLARRTSTISARVDTCRWATGPPRRITRSSATWNSWAGSTA